MESALEDQICAIIWVVMLSILNFPRAAVLLIKKYPLTTPSKHDQPCNMTTAMNVHDTLRNVVSPGHDRKDSNTKWHESICHRSCFQSWHNTLCFQASHGISLFCSGLPNTEAILRDELGRRGIIYECIRFAHNVAERLGQCQRATCWICFGAGRTFCSFPHIMILCPKLNIIQLNARCLGMINVYTYIYSYIYIHVCMCKYIKEIEMIEQLSGADSAA